MKFIDSKNVVTTSRKRVLVAFGDIKGFGHWLRRAGTSIEEEVTLVTKLYSRVLSAGLSKGYYTKLLGDGFLLVRELNEKNNWEEVLRDLFLLFCLNKGIEADIAALPNPRPDGFRIRVVAGHATKLLTRICPEGSNCLQQSDYIGYPVNFASRLLHVMPEVPCICHESIREIIGNRGEIIGKRKGEGFRIEFKRLDNIKYRERGVDSEDLKELWSFGKIVNINNAKLIKIDDHMKG